MASTLLNLSLLSVLFAMCHGLLGGWDFVPKETGCFIPFSSLKEIFCQVLNEKTANPDLDAMLGRVSTRMAIPLVLRGHANAIEKASEVKIIRFRAFGNLAIGKSLFPFTALNKVSMEGSRYDDKATITIDPEAFKHNYQISSLSIVSINLQADFEQLLAPLSSSLQHLSMSIGNGKDLDIAAGLKVLTKLNELYISGSDLVEFPDLQGSAATLTRLELRYTNINGTLKAESLRSLVNLKRLDLSVNKLDSVEPDAFSTLTKLTSMELQRNNISNFTPDMFKNNQELTYLDLSGGSEGGNPSPGVQCKSVRQMLPKLHALYVGQYICIYDPQVAKLVDGTLGIMDILGKK